MARHEADREDLFAELLSATSRWELAVPTFPAPVVAGIRSDARLSIYFGPEPCYHFNAENRLQRAFVGNALFRTQGSTLARLQRQRRESETLLLRNDLSADELTRFLEEMRTQLHRLDYHLSAGDATILRQAGNAEAEFPTLLERLKACRLADPPLAAPYAGRRR